MGTKIGEFEECTKIKSPSEMDAILKQVGPAAVDDDVGGFDEQTQLGNVQELVARSMLIDDPPPPPPVIARSSSSTNVVRRQTSPHVVQRVSATMPSARGSLSDLPVPPAPEQPDDVAFDPWEETPVKSISQPLPIVLPPPELDAAPHVPAPDVTATPAPVVTPRGVRWGVVAWFMLLAATIGVCSVGYLRIAQLETELAQTRSALERSSGR